GGAMALRLRGIDLRRHRNRARCDHDCARLAIAAGRRILQLRGRQASVRLLYPLSLRAIRRAPGRSCDRHAERPVAGVSGEMTWKNPMAGTATSSLSSRTA